MERLPALTLAIGRISKQFQAAEVEHFQLTQSLRTTRQDVPKLICNRLLRSESKFPGKVSKIVQISMPEG